MDNRELTERELDAVSAGHHHHHNNSAPNGTPPSDSTPAAPPHYGYDLTQNKVV